MLKQVFNLTKPHQSVRVKRRKLLMVTFSPIGSVRCGSPTFASSDSMPSDRRGRVQQKQVTEANERQHHVLYSFGPAEMLDKLLFTAHWQK